MLAAGDNAAVPLTESVVPATGVNEPVLSSRVSTRTPPFTCTDPVLAHGIVTVFVPLPVLRNKPALANSGVPELRANELPLACRSNVPAGALLNKALLQIICPAVHAPAPPLTSVPPLNVLVLPLRLIVPLAKTISVDPEAPKTPL